MQLSKVLFVDDEPNILAAFARQLRREADIVTACGPEPGMAALRSHEEFSVIVVDMQMPGMNGIEFLHYVRDLQPDAIRVMLTGNADTDTFDRVVTEVGVFRFLLKPCDGEELSAAIADAIRAYNQAKAA